MHGLYSDYPLASGKVKVSKDMLSEFKLQIIEKNEFCLIKNEKLIHSLDNKKYKLYCKTLWLKATTSHNNYEINL